MSERVKRLMVEDLSRELRSTDSCVVLRLGRLDVTTTTLFRADLRHKGVRVRVLKNRVAAHAMQSLGWNGVGDLFEGTSAVAFGEGGAVAVSKCLSDWVRKLPDKIVISGGFLDGRILSVDEVKKLATIPDKKTLYSMIASVVTAPMSQIAGLLGEMISGVARAVGAAAEKAGPGTTES